MSDPFDFIPKPNSTVIPEIALAIIRDPPQGRYWIPAVAVMTGTGAAYSQHKCWIPAFGAGLTGFSSQSSGLSAGDHYGKFCPSVLIKLVLKYDVQGVNDPGNEAQQCQKDIEPEMALKANFQKYADRRQKNGKKNLDWIGYSDSHWNLLSMK